MKREETFLSRFHVFTLHVTTMAYNGTNGTPRVSEFKLKEEMCEHRRQSR